MAIRTLSELIPLTFSWQEKPTDHRIVARNTLRYTIWDSLFMGSLASICELFIRYAPSEGTWATFASYEPGLQKLTWGCGASIVVVATYMIYKSLRFKTDHQQLNQDIYGFTKSIVILSAMGALAAFVAQRLCKADHPINPIAGYLFMPLLGASIGALDTLLFQGMVQNDLKAHQSKGS